MAKHPPPIEPLTSPPEPKVSKYEEDIRREQRLFFIMFFWTPKRTKNRPQTGGIGCRVLSRVFCESIRGSAFSRYIASIVAGACKRAYAPTTTATT